MIHRDLKLENLILSGVDQVKVIKKIFIINYIYIYKKAIDFGIAGMAS